MTSAVGLTSSPPVLVVSRDPVLVGELRRLAAAAGVLLDVVEGPSLARSTWATAPVVLLGPEVLVSLGDTAPPRRERVHVVALEPVADALFRAALAVGAETVLELPGAGSWLVEALVDCADGGMGAGCVVGVVGGCGGAGATTFAAALAAAAASELTGAGDAHPVTLVDGDPLGPGLERVAGLDDLEGARWGRLLESAGRLGSRSLLASLPQRDGLAVLGWGTGARAPLRGDVVREVLRAAARGSALVVVDLPRYAHPAAEELLRACDHVVLVTPLALPAVASAAQVVGQVLPPGTGRHLVARGSATALDAEQVAAALGTTLVAVMPDQRRLDEAVEMGVGPLRSRRGPLARAARSILGALA